MGVKDIIPEGIGTVIWSWNYDEGQFHRNKLNNVLYFPDSTVNILSATELAESTKDDEEIWVLKKTKYYIFTWYFWMYKKTITHSEKCLP